MAWGWLGRVIRLLRCRDTWALFEEKLQRSPDPTRQSLGRKPGQKRLKALTTDLLLVSPGEVLLEEFLRPMGISQYRLAQAIDVPESRINAIVKGRRAITADTDLRLCRFFKQAKQALESVLPTIQPLGRAIV